MPKNHLQNIIIMLASYGYQPLVFSILFNGCTEWKILGTYI